MKKVILILLSALLLLAAAGCQKEEQPANVDLKGVLADIQEQIPVDGVAELSESDMFDLYGIEAKDLKQFAGYIKMDGVSADEVIMAEGVDADATERIRGHMEDRLNALKNESVKYNAEQYAVVEKCSVRVKGNYVCLLVSPELDKMNGIYDGYVK
jgi:hypothetical protein